MSQAGSRQSQSIDAKLRSQMPAIGIDLGGTKLSAAVVSDCKVITEARTVPTPSGAQNIVAALVDLIKQFQAEHTLSGVGIATAGVVNCVTGDITGSTGNLPGWAGTPLKKLVESKTALPVLVDNDANAAAYGDSLALGLSSAVCVVGVTLGTGIGTGIVINGKPYRGANWGAGECGHMRISLDNKRLCTCGLWDCWEAYGAGRGLVATCKELLHNRTNEQTDLARDPENLTTRQITSAAEAGDIIAQKALLLYHEHIAQGLANLAHILNPECFILSGGMSKVVDIELIREIVVDRTMDRFHEKLQIVKSPLGDFAGIVGAAQSALDATLLTLSK
jgi:glucokinase